MSEDFEQNRETAERLRAELDALLRQHEQYTLALDAAMDPRTSLRLQRTLERLDDEIEGLQEALTGAEAAAREPQLDGQSSISTQGVIPEWDDDEDDEPATNIYHAADGGVGNVFTQGGLPGFPPSEPPPPRSADDPPTVTLKAPWESPMSDEHPVAGHEEQTGTVTPPVQSPAGSTTGGADPEAQPMRRPAEPASAPTAGSSFSSLPPPAAADGEQWGRTEIVPPSYETQPHLQKPRGEASSSPFGGGPPIAPPPAASSTAVGPPLSAPPGPGSPFGGPPPAGSTNAPFPSGGYSVLSDGPSDGEWSLGSRLLLAIVVLLFLGGVGYILAQGP